MNETNDKELDTVDADTKARPWPRPAGLALIGIGAAIVILGIVFYMTRSNGNAGRPVPPPRSSIDEPSTETVGGTLTLTPEQIANAGITVETVGEQLSTESAETSSTGTVEANTYRDTPAVSLISGVVRRVIPELGQGVTAGQTVAIIFSDEYAATQSRYIALRTEAANARRSYERSQRLVAINAPGRGEMEEAAKQRKAAEAALSEMRNRYERTTRLIKIGAASREELEQDNTKLRTAEAELEQARLRETRAAQLLPIGSEVRAASEEALNKLQTAETELAATRQRLVLYGMPAGRIDALRSPAQVSAELAVPAPSSGTVTKRAVNPGEAIEANKELLSVTDLSTVWVVAQVYERDLGRMRVGSGASVSTDAFPDRLFRGTITYIDPALDETTRTGKVRVEVSNPDRLLKIGMYVRVAFGAVRNAERTVPVVPAAAIQNINGRQVVFVATADPNVFDVRQVRAGVERNGRVEVFEGLTVGDRVVVEGAFMLRAEWLKTNRPSSQS